MPEDCEIVDDETPGVTLAQVMQAPVTNAQAILAELSKIPAAQNVNDMAVKPSQQMFTQTRVDRLADVLTRALDACADELETAETENRHKRLATFRLALDATSALFNVIGIRHNTILAPTLIMNTRFTLPNGKGK